MLGKDKNALALTYGFPDTSASPRKQKIQQLRHKQRYSTETHYIGDNILSSGINNFGIGIYLERIIQEYFLVKKMATLSTYQQDTKNAVDIILKNESLKIGVDITSSSSYEGLNTNELEKKKTKILALTQMIDTTEKEKIISTSISREIDSHSIMILYLSPWMRNEIIACFHDWLLYNKKGYWSDYVQKGNPKGYIENILSIFEIYFSRILYGENTFKEKTDQYEVYFQNNIFTLFIKGNRVLEYHYFPTQKADEKIASLENHKTK